MLYQCYNNLVALNGTCNQITKANQDLRYGEETLESLKGYNRGGQP